MTTGGLMTGLLLGGAAQIGAQGQPPVERGFINVNVGAQPQRRDIHTSHSFPLYDEVATVTSTQPIKNGVIVDASGGYRLGPRLAVGVGFSSFETSSASRVTAAIPDLFFVDRPKTVVTEASNLDHTERGVHLQLLWFLPVTDRIDVALSAGPSFIWVTQDLTANVSVPAGTQAVSLTQTTESGTAIGANVGFDGSYMFTPRYGTGVFIRYAGGSVDLPTVSDLKVGGFRTGFGFRIRF